MACHALSLCFLDSHNVIFNLYTVNFQPFESLHFNRPITKCSAVSFAIYMKRKKHPIYFTKKFSLTKTATPKKASVLRRAFKTPFSRQTRRKHF